VGGSYEHILQSPPPGPARGRKRSQNSRRRLKEEMLGVLKAAVSIEMPLTAIEMRGASAMMTMMTMILIILPM